MSAKDTTAALCEVGAPIRYSGTEEECRQKLMRWRVIAEPLSRVCVVNLFRSVKKTHKLFCLGPCGLSTIAETTFAFKKQYSVGD